ncbi:hypothetical protein E2320_015751, partial [Naja naja]
MSPDERP